MLGLFNYAVNGINYFFHDILHLPELPDFIDNTLDLFFDFIADSVSLVSWMFPSSVWGILCTYLLALTTVSLSVKFYNMVLRVVDAIPIL